MSWHRLGETPAIPERMVERVRNDLSSRGKHGLWAHALAGSVSAAMFYGTVPAWEIRWYCVAVVLLMTAIRTAVILLRRPVSAEQWFGVYSVLLVCTSLSWGVMLSAAIVRSPWSPETTMLLLMLIAISMGGLIAVAPQKYTGIAYQLSVWVPTTIATVYMGLVAMSITLLTMVLYVTVQASHYSRDYRDSLRREMDLEEAREAAEVASRAKSSFVANISHEIRTPMHGVLGMLDLALAEPLQPGPRSMVETARNSADSMLALLDDILDFSKIEADRMELEAIPFRLTELVEIVRQMLSVTAMQKGLELSVEIGPGVPAVVIGDPVRLRQVLLNLATNAIKFTAEGWVKIRVESNGMEDGTYLLSFLVEDTGIGIPADKQELIFDAFAQADSATTRKFGGSGLGLAICRRLTELMGGQISLVSTPGEGSSFRFTLPFAAGTLAEPSRIEAISAPLRPLRLLVAEDNLVNQRLVRAILERAGHSVEIASNGALAVERWQTGGFDAILMDLQMPDLGGDEATARIRAAEPPGQRIPIIGLTANANALDRQRCFDVGMDAYLTKPFRPADLLEALAQHAISPAPTVAQRG